ncbi:unnamed protein product [Prorocentrum cordatum]|uniref:H(+)-exporting diphosphatase n=1 Tax=Prorocentrum cordatum TaxID=2364126 RepID=A0ABN9XB25_9DINO|nr:unnamed protein product [Polarella glacialis]
MGLASVLSYSVTSNASYCLITFLAMLSVMRATGASPLTSQAAAGQFVASYAGLWLLNNLIRPLRIALAVAVAPVFNRALDRIESALSVKRGAAFAIGFVLTTLLVCAMFFAALQLPAIITGVPLGSVKNLGALVKAGKAASS